MKLQLKKMGCEIKEGCGNGTDLINYRLRAEFTDIRGIKVCCDNRVVFGRVVVWNVNKK